MTDDEERVEAIRGWLRSQPPTGSLGVKGHPATITVTALRDFMLWIEPSIEDDLDGFIEQIQDLSKDKLRMIGGDPVTTCEQLRIRVGKLSEKQMSSLAMGRLSDRAMVNAQGFSLLVVIASVVFTAIVTAVVTWALT